MSALVFVDANVFIYAFASGEPLKSRRCKDWLALLWEQRRGRTGIQVVSETYATLTRKYHVPADKAWGDLSSVLSWSPQPVDREVLHGAREIEARYRLSWWDSLIVAAAQLQSCGVLLTEDLQDGEIFGALRVVNPFLHEIREPAAPYVVASAPVVHRPRGRPRRAYA